MVHFLMQITNFVLGKPCDVVVCAEIECNKQISVEFDAKCVASPTDVNLLLEYAEFLKTLRVCQHNFDKIVQLYERGISLGSSVAKMRLGEFYMENALEDIDMYDRGLFLMMELVKVGFAPACIALGNYHAGKTRDIVQAYYWYVKAMDICGDDRKCGMCMEQLMKWFRTDALRGMLKADGKEKYCEFL
jgi:hypothetical protein